MPTLTKPVPARSIAATVPETPQRSLRRWLSTWQRRRAGVDPVTGLPTGRSVLAAAELKRRTVPGPHAPNPPMSVLRCDLDARASRGKGALSAADALLSLVGQALQTGLRQGDMLGRGDGESFIVVLPASDASAARMVGERLRALVEACSVRLGTQGPLQPLSICVGVSAVRLGEPLVKAIERAERALAEARREGPNRVQLARSPD